ncbi:MAG: formyltetrahydrofolate deformylase, partial [Halioglobus sp.]|nr:formyltetrahydrofolate deformylase [Halioglobus sp.]
MERTYRLVLACPDRTGIVARVSSFLSAYNGWITEASYHADQKNGWFFMRNEIKASSMPFSLAEFRAAFQPIADEFSMQWSISDSEQKKKLVLMVSRESHCLADLLHRWHSKELHADIAAVISNHDDLRSMVEWHGIPYHLVPVDPKDKAPAFREVEALVDGYATDLLVLARYMQIL